jgi:hypothetical protein
VAATFHVAGFDDKKGTTGYESIRSMFAYGT